MGVSLYTRMIQCKQRNLAMYKTLQTYTFLASILLSLQILHVGCEILLYLKAFQRVGKGA